MSGDAPGAAGTREAPRGERPFHVFVNYRREDTAGHAGRLYDALAARFGEDHVFMDIDAIEAGEDFAQVVEQSVGSCDVLIALIGRHWVAATDREGRRRLHKPHDWVRLEIQAALARKDTRVIPALVQGAEMPSPDELPEPLRELSDRNAAELSDGRWRYDVERLIRRLEELAGSRAPGRAPPAERADVRPRARRTKRFVPLLAGAALLVVAGLAAAALLLSRGDDSEREAVERYVRQTDARLARSEDTRGDLNGLIGRVKARAIPRDEALTEIGRIIGQRRELLDSLPPDPPSSFGHARELLRASIVASLGVDEAVRAWIAAFLDGSPEARALEDTWRRLSASTTRQKRRFLTEYNHLRERELDLPPTNPDY